MVTLNSNNSYNFLCTVPTDSDVPSPYTQFNISSDYHDESSLSNYLSSSNTPIFLSLNTQSLLSKFEGIKQLFSALSSLNIHIDILALQVTFFTHSYHVGATTDASITAVANMNVSGRRRSPDRRSPDRRRGRSRQGRRQTPGPDNRKHDSSTLCFYHSRFGQKAMKCEAPCSWTEN